MNKEDNFTLHTFICAMCILIFSFYLPFLKWPHLLYQFSRAGISKYDGLWFEQQKFFFFKFWRLEVQGLCWQVWFLLRPPWLADATFLLCPHMAFFLSRYLSGVSPSSVRTSFIGLEPTHMISFKLNYLFKGPVSTYSHFLRCTGN